MKFTYPIVCQTVDSERSLDLLVLELEQTFAVNYSSVIDDYRNFSNFLADFFGHGVDCLSLCDIAYERECNSTLVWKIWNRLLVLGSLVHPSPLAYETRKSVLCSICDTITPTPPSHFLVGLVHCA